MEAKFVIWELWPARWVPGEAWAFIDGEWREVDSSDVAHNCREVDEVCFNAVAINLKALPAIAFHGRPDR